MLVDINRIETRMAELELTSQALAQAAGLSPFTIHRILKGTTAPKPATIGKLAKSLQTSVQEITKIE